MNELEELRKKEDELWTRKNKTRALEEELRNLLSLGTFKLKDYELIENKIKHILNMFRG